MFPFTPSTMQFVALPLVKGLDVTTIGRVVAMGRVMVLATVDIINIDNLPLTTTPTIGLIFHVNYVIDFATLLKNALNASTMPLNRCTFYTLCYQSHSNHLDS